ncbi:hypothetical protein [Zhihengliuella sp.]|uniref:hypothetical protein n=1 Tax=Zhihengliuella sp. TaxID=1954483 RepID=UPI0028111F98|nr:hypothetical protein [Zhihengliuella sp.]
MFTEVDYFTPMVLLACAVIVGLFGVPLVVHALFRWRAFRRDSESLQTYARRRSLGVESGLGAVLLLGGAALAVAGLMGLSRAEDAVVANILRADPSIGAVEDYRWTGAHALVDLRLTDGSVHEDVRVVIEDDGRPVIEGVPGSAEPTDG